MKQKKLNMKEAKEIRRKLPLQLKTFRDEQILDKLSNPYLKIRFSQLMQRRTKTNRMIRKCIALQTWKKTGDKNFFPL